MVYEEMEKDVAYRVTKGNTDGGILAGDIIYIDSRSEDLVMVGPCGGWYSKTDELLEDDVTDFHCELADEYRVLVHGLAKSVVLKSELEKVLARGLH